MRENSQSVLVEAHNGGLDCGSTNVDANRNRCNRIGAGDGFAHNGLCIIPTLCNSTGRIETNYPYILRGEGVESYS